MKKLEERIQKEGIVRKEEDILQIDMFLNHQIDTELMNEIGKEFYKIFKDTKPDKILTIESSGIAIASFTSIYFDYCPVVYAKKSEALNMDDKYFVARERSYTRAKDVSVRVSKNYLKENERVLIIDDFLATGEALNSLIEICRQANCKIVGCGITDCKVYQPGLKRINDLGIDVKCLAKIKKLDKEVIEFEEDK